MVSAGWPCSGEATRFPIPLMLYQPWSQSSTRRPGTCLKSRRWSVSRRIIATSHAMVFVARAYGPLRGPSWLPRTRFVSPHRRHISQRRVASLFLAHRVMTSVHPGVARHATRAFPAAFQRSGASCRILKSSRDAALSHKITILPQHWAKQTCIDVGGRSRPHIPRGCSFACGVRRKNPPVPPVWFSSRSTCWRKSAT